VSVKYVCVVYDREMGCICVRPPKADKQDGVGPSQTADNHPSAGEPVGPDSIALTHAGNKPPPPPVPPKTREITSASFASCVICKIYPTSVFRAERF